MNIGIIKDPLDYGAGTRGTCYAPSTILDSSIVEDLESLGHKVSIVDCKVEHHDENKTGSVPNAKFLDPIVKSSNSLAVLTDRMTSNGDFPLILGGDHSVLLGSLAGISAALHRRNKIVGVLYIDAHGDFNTSDTSPTGNIHGQCLSASCGVGLKQLTGIYESGAKIDSRNICIVGARDIDKEERCLLRQNSVTVYTATDIEMLGISSIVSRSLEYLESRVDHIHLSFDVDSVDPIYAPGTGIHCPGGMTYREAIVIADMLKGHPKLMSADVVEYNPLKDKDGKTKNLCLDFIRHLMGWSYL